MKILILSDIHANYQALTSIKEEADMVFCLGDIVNYGPNPKECLDWVKKHAINLAPLKTPASPPSLPLSPTLPHQRLLTGLVCGNHDNAVGRGVDCGCSLKYKELSEAGKAFTVATLNIKDKKFLGSLPIQEYVEVNNFSFLLSHGSPGGDMYRYLTPDISDSELLSELKACEKKIRGFSPDFVFIGHTHLPMIRKLNEVTIVNPGSVGQPRDGIPLCSYAVWNDGNIEIKRVKYDIEATIKAYEATNLSMQHIRTLSQLLKNAYLA